MFPVIRHIEDMSPVLISKDEIKGLSVNFEDMGIQTGTIVCYLFAGPETFDSPLAREARGVAFDSEGNVISRPLHKFFNVGEKSHTSKEIVIDRWNRGEVAAVYEKLDGSMISTAWYNGLYLRSKKSFNSDVVRLAWSIVDHNPKLKKFCAAIASAGMTATFEITHPAAQIVVRHKQGKLRLLHVRNNMTGKYVTNSVYVQEMIDLCDIECVNTFSFASAEAMFDTLETMQDMEGYVIQFTDGDMVKVKCPWYLRLHRSVTFLRQRDIALLVLKEEIDDAKSALTEVGIDVKLVEKIEQDVLYRLKNIVEQVEGRFNEDRDLSRKDFAIKNNKFPYFKLLMDRYSGKDVNYQEWFILNRLKDVYSLDPLTASVAEED